MAWRIDAAPGSVRVWRRTRRGPGGAGREDSRDAAAVHERRCSPARLLVARAAHAVAERKILHRTAKADAAKRLHPAARESLDDDREPFHHVGDVRGV